MEKPFILDRPIVTSLADTDLYKFTMAQAYLHHHPGFQSAFLYRCRTPGIDLRPLVPAIREQINHVGTLNFTKDELAFIAGLGYTTTDFIDFLRLYRPNPDAVEITEKDGQVGMRISGSLVHVTWWEIYILAIVSEIYGAANFSQPDYAEGDRRLMEKIALVRKHQQNWRSSGEDFQFRLIEFGTRRRFSKEVQERVLDILQEHLADCLVGTSNVDAARRRGLRPFGTMAHEWLQMHQATKVSLANSQSLALDIWAREYRGKLGIALTDVITMDAFLRDFDLYFAKLFDGGRHDSGDPYEWADKFLAHYINLGINPKTKYAVFSDSLDFPKALALCETYEGRILTSFGIGTNLTNDLGHTVVNHVVKMTECNGRPVAKISDAPGKSMCQDDAYLQYLKHVFEVAPHPTQAVQRIRRPTIGGGL